MRTLLDTLSDATRAELVALTPEAVRDLAHDVRLHRMRDQRAQYSTEPAEAARAARDLLRGSLTREADDPVRLVVSNLVAVRLALLGAATGANDLDRIDADALLHLLDDALDVLRVHDARLQEANDRLRRVTHPET